MLQHHPCRRQQLRQPNTKLKQPRPKILPPLIYVPISTAMNVVATGAGTLTPAPFRGDDCTCCCSSCCRDAVNKEVATTTAVGSTSTVGERSTEQLKKNGTAQRRSRLISRTRDLSCLRGGSNLQSSTYRDDRARQEPREPCALCDA